MSVDGGKQINNRTWIIESPKLSDEYILSVQFSYHMYSYGTIAVDASSSHDPSAGWISERDYFGFIQDPVWKESKGSKWAFGGDYWRTATVELPWGSRWFRILATPIKAGPEGDIGIDNIVVNVTGNLYENWVGVGVAGSRGGGRPERWRGTHAYCAHP